MLFLASRASREVQHDSGDVAVHPGLGPEHPRHFPAVCGPQNVTERQREENTNVNERNKILV